MDPRAFPRMKRGISTLKCVHRDCLTMNQVPARLNSSSSLYQDPRRKWVAPKDGASIKPSKDRKRYMCHGFVTRLWAKVMIAHDTSKLVFEKAKG